MGRKQMISLNCSIFIFQSMIFALVYASSAAVSNKEDSITVCKDLIGLAERIAILETKQNIYTEDRQRLTRLETRYIEDRQQLFRYFELLNETTKRQMNIEKENDMLKRGLGEMRREQNEMKLNMEELTNTVQKLKLEISNVSQQSNENYDNLTVIVNEVKSNMEEQIKDVTEIHKQDNTTLFDIVQKVKYDVDEEHMTNQQQTNQQHNLSSTIKEIRRSVQQTDATYKQKINEIDGNIQSKFADVDQSLGISDQRIQTLSTNVSLLQSKYNGNGAVYTRWGKKQCAGNDTELVYSGYVGGPWYNRPGSGNNPVCLTPDPLWGHFNDSLESHLAYIYGAEYHTLEFARKMDNANVPCAVCWSKNAVVTLMIPGRNKCYPGWNEEYHGYLVANREEYQASIQYTCMDSSPDVVVDERNSEDGTLFLSVEGRCGSLPCPPYINGREITCAVCSK